MFSICIGWKVKLTHTDTLSTSYGVDRVAPILRYQISRLHSTTYCKLWSTINLVIMFPVHTAIACRLFWQLYWRPMSEVGCLNNRENYWPNWKLWDMLKMRYSKIFASKLLAWNPRLIYFAMISMVLCYFGNDFSLERVIQRQIGLFFFFSFFFGK